MLSALAILDLAPGASRSEIKAAWKREAKRWHPDRSQGDAERFKAAQRAFRRLTGASHRVTPARHRERQHRDRRQRKPAVDTSPSLPAWYELLWGLCYCLSLPLGVITFTMTIPCMVIGLISLVLHVALQRPIDADPGWWVAMIIFAAWNLLLLPTWYVVVEYLDPWIQIRLLSREWRKRSRRTRRRSGK